VMKMLQIDGLVDQNNLKMPVLFGQLNASWIIL
jgi:hypothetical protein